jgi:hypothetical protein
MVLTSISGALELSCWMSVVMESPIMFELTQEVSRLISLSSSFARAANLFDETNDLDFYMFCLDWWIWRWWQRPFGFGHFRRGVNHKNNESSNNVEETVIDYILIKLWRDNGANSRTTCDRVAGQNRTEVIVINLT